MKKGSKVKIIGYNPNNSHHMNQQLEKDFPIGTICKITDKYKPKDVYIKKRSSSQKNFVICEKEFVSFCKQMSLDYCMELENEKGDQTHICYVLVEEI